MIVDMLRWKRSMAGVRIAWLVLTYIFSGKGSTAQEEGLGTRLQQHMCGAKTCNRYDEQEALSATPAMLQPGNPDSSHAPARQS